MKSEGWLMTLQLRSFKLDTQNFISNYYQPTSPNSIKDNYQKKRFLHHWTISTNLESFLIRILATNPMHIIFSPHLAISCLSWKKLTTLILLITFFITSFSYFWGVLLVFCIECICFHYWIAIGNLIRTN